MQKSRQSIAALVIALGFGAGDSFGNATALGVGGPEHEIALSIIGEGAGLVDIRNYFTGFFAECRSTCTVSVPRGMNVWIMPRPDEGSRFIGLSGRCAGPYRCSFDVVEDVSLEARFEHVTVAPPRFDQMNVSSLGGLATYPNALDDEGALAGRYRSGDEIGIFLWTGKMQTFPDPDGFWAGVAATAGGRVVGTLVPRSVSGPLRAYVAAEGTLTELGTLGGNWSLARAVSSGGTIAGESITADGDVHAFSWRSGVMSDLGTLPGKPTSLAWAIDEDGRVIGTACDDYRLGFPIGCISLDAINAAGDAVGHIAFPIGDGSPSLAILLRDGELFGPINRAALAINSRGQILTGGERVTTLLTPRRDQ